MINIFWIIFLNNLYRWGSDLTFYIQYPILSNSNVYILIFLDSNKNIYEGI